MLEYEGLHLICFQCGRYGRKSTQCAEFIKKFPEYKVKTQDSQETVKASKLLVGAIEISQNPKKDSLGKLRKSVSLSKDDEDPSYGPWMIATRRPRKSQQNKKILNNVEGDLKSKVEGHQGAQSHQSNGSRFNVLNDSKLTMETSKDISKEEMQVPEQGELQHLKMTITAEPSPANPKHIEFEMQMDAGTSGKPQIKKGKSLKVVKNYRRRLLLRFIVWSEMVL